MNNSEIKKIIGQLASKGHTDSIALLTYVQMNPDWTYTHRNAKDALGWGEHKCRNAISPLIKLGLVKLENQNQYVFKFDENDQPTPPNNPGPGNNPKINPSTFGRIPNQNPFQQLRSTEKSGNLKVNNQDFNHTPTDNYYTPPYQNSKGGYSFLGGWVVTCTRARATCHVHVNIVNKVNMNNSTSRVILKENEFFETNHEHDMKHDGQYQNSGSPGIGNTATPFPGGEIKKEVNSDFGIDKSKSLEKSDTNQGKERVLKSLKYENQTLRSIDYLKKCKENDFYLEILNNKEFGFVSKHLSGFKKERFIRDKESIILLMEKCVFDDSYDKSIRHAKVRDPEVCFAIWNTLSVEEQSLISKKYINHFNECTSRGNGRFVKPLLAFMKQRYLWDEPEEIKRSHYEPNFMEMKNAQSPQTVQDTPGNLIEPLSELCKNISELLDISSEQLVPAYHNEKLWIGCNSQDQITLLAKSPAVNMLHLDFKEKHGQKIYLRLNRKEERA